VNVSFAAKTDTFEYLRNSSRLKKTERSDIHKYSICNLQFSISDCSGCILGYGNEE